MRPGFRLSTLAGASLSCGVGPSSLYDVVKTFFTFSALLSVVLGFHSVWTSVAGRAHNHYATRYFLLYDSGWRDISPSWWELSEADVSSQPEKFGKAYRESVLDAHRLAGLSGRLQSQCLILAAMLFVVSCIGWWTARRQQLSVQQARCSEPGDGAPVCNRRSVAPGH